MYINKSKKIVIKIGSSIIIDEKGKVRKELFKYSNKLTQKKEIIVFNKTDMISEDEINKKIDIFNKKIKKKIYTISALKHRGLKTIRKVLVNYAL